jgi:hypothetical protein
LLARGIGAAGERHKCNQCAILIAITIHSLRS